MGKTMSVDQTLGKIDFNLNKKKFIAGEAIQGTVNLHLLKDCPSNTIYLVLKGKEKIVMARQEMARGNYHRRNSYSNSDYVTYLEKDSEKIIDQQIPLMNPRGMNFTRGEHRVPFYIPLPPNLPNSFNYEYWDHGKKCKAQVKYKLTVALTFPNTKNGIFKE